MNKMKQCVKVHAQTAQKGYVSRFFAAKMVHFCGSKHGDFGGVFHRNSTIEISYKYSCKATEVRHPRESNLGFSLDLFSFQIFIVFSSFLLWRKFVRRRSHCNSRWQINTRCFCSFHISFVIYFLLLFICFFVTCNLLIQKSCFVSLPPWVTKSPFHDLLISPPWTYSIE